MLKTVTNIDDDGIYTVIYDQRILTSFRNKDHKLYYRAPMDDSTDGRVYWIYFEEDGSITDIDVKLSVEDSPFSECCKFLTRETPKVMGRDGHFINFDSRIKDALARVIKKSPENYFDENGDFKYREQPLFEPDVIKPKIQKELMLELVQALKNDVKNGVDKVMTYYQMVQATENNKTKIVKFYKSYEPINDKFKDLGIENGVSDGAFNADGEEEMNAEQFLKILIDQTNSMSE